MTGSRFRSRVASLLLAMAAPSAAQTPPPSGAARDLPAAESLYEAGRQLVLEGRCELAVQRLQASQSLDPAVGTLLLIGHCQEKLGKTASAWATFRAARSLAQNVRQPDREHIAEARARALEPRLARMEIALPAEADTSAWSITENGRELPRALLGAAVPVDPGPRELRVSAPGYEPWSARVVIADAGGTTRVRVPALVPSPRDTERRDAPRREPAAPLEPAGLSVRAEPPVRAEPTPVEPAPPAPSPVRDRAEPAGVLRTFSYLGVGLGAVGLGVGATYGILAQDRFEEAVKECPARVCSERGERLHRSGDRHATVATVSAISGAVLLAGGLGLWLAMPSGDDAPASAALGVSPLGEGGLSLDLVGRF